MNRLKLTVPARAGYLHLLRTVAASAAARSNFDIDAIDDLSLLIDEAAAYLLDIPSPTRTLGLIVETRDALIKALLWTDAETDDWPPQGWEDGLAWKILSGLADDAALVHQDGHPAVRLTKKPFGGMEQDVE